MPKKTLKLIVPSAARMRSIKSLRLLGDWIYATNLWHINRYSASMAFFVGLFVAFMPIPGQMILAAIFYLAYKVGAMIVEVPLQEVEFELSFYWLSNSLYQIWKPFLLGCLICGLFFGSLGYFVISMLWRWRVAYHWHERKRLREARKLTDPG